MKTILASIVAATLALGSLTPCLAGQDYAGIVKAVAGDAVIVRNDTTIKAKTNTKLLEGDLVRTGPGGKVGLLFEDDTVISMGSNTKIVIERYLFHPAEKKMSFITRIFQGTVSYLSGQLVKLAPNLVHIETPYGTVGMRGTHVLIKVD
jgi:hypothetical protein